MADKKSVLTESDDLKDSDELIIVEEDPSKKAAPVDNAPDQEDTRIANSEEEGDSEDDDSSEDHEREAIRERRRLEKLERKQRREEAIKRDKLELDFLRKRNDDLERRITTQEQRSHQADLRGLDAEIVRAQQEAEMAEKVIAKAVAAGNGDDVAQALKYRDAAIQRAQQLSWQKQSAATAAPQVSPIDAQTLGHAQKFIAENPWYDAQGRDEDSAIVLAIDQALSKDGYSPQSPDYWAELRRRAARRLPERFQQQQQTREPRGGPAVGSGREHAPASTRKEVYISPERKQALIDAGVWDDPVLRMKYVKRYAEYDRNKKE